MQDSANKTSNDDSIRENNQNQVYTSRESNASSKNETKKPHFEISRNMTLKLNGKKTDNQQVKGRENADGDSVVRTENADIKTDIAYTES